MPHDRQSCVKWPISNAFARGYDRGIWQSISYVCRIDEIVDPHDQVGLVFWRSIDTEDLYTASIDNECRRFFNLKALREGNVRVDIDFQHFKPPYPFPGEIIQHWLEDLAINAEAGCEHDEEGFSPI